VVLPSVPDGFQHVFHQYTVRVTSRDGLQSHLSARGVGSGVYYPTPIHRLRPYLTEKQQPDPRWELPETDRAAAEVLSLPVHPGLSEEALQQVVDAVNDWGNRH
jgi:dTDP-4-amino-4,6-dideoxygalactose transaminase